MLSNKDSMASVIFVNSMDQSLDKSKQAVNKCRVFMDLDVPSVQQLREFNILTKSDHELSKLFDPQDNQNKNDGNERSQSQSLIGGEILNSSPIANAFFLASKMFSQTHVKTYSSKRVVFITDKDTPNDSTLHRTTINTRFKDLSNCGVEIIPYFVIPNVSYMNKVATFDPLAFYEDLLVASTTKELDPMLLKPHSVEDTKDLIHHFTTLGTPTRSLFTNKIQLTENLSIGVKAYLIISAKAFPRHETIYTKNVTTITHSREKDADEVVKEVMTKNDQPPKHFFLKSKTNHYSPVCIGTLLLKKNNTI